MPNQTDAISVLSECPLFAGADPEDIEALASVARTAKWPANASIFQRGDESSFFLIMLSGRVRLNLVSLSGRELTLRHAGQGETVGEMGVLDGKIRSADATAISDVECLVISRVQLEDLMAQRPGIGRAVINYLTNCLRDTTYKLESVALYDLESRLARFILAGLRQVHGDELAPTAVLKLNLGQGDIASILGASRPKINRAFGALQEAGAIERRDDGLHCDVEILDRIAEPDGA